jgi:uncharacterized protein (DUF1697 family)
MRYVALLRGINVTGKNMIKMETLRETFEALGFENVKSYINSGNLAFDCRSPQVSKGVSPDTELAMKIHDAIQKDFGFDISVMVRSSAEIKNIVSNNPFEGQFENHKDVHVFFLERELTADQEKLLLEQANESEFIAVSGRSVYYMLRIRFPDSALCKGFIDKKLKVATTGRNWRTVTTIAEM